MGTPLDDRQTDVPVMDTPLVSTPEGDTLTKQERDPSVSLCGVYRRRGTTQGCWQLGRGAGSGEKG